MEDREFEDLRCPSLGRRWSWIRRALSPRHDLELGVPARLLRRQGRRLAEQQLGPRPPWETEQKWGCSGRRSAMGDRLAPGTGGGGGGHLTKPLVALEVHHGGDGGGGLLLLASSRRLTLKAASPETTTTTAAGLTGSKALAGFLAGWNTKESSHSLWAVGE